MRVVRWMRSYSMTFSWQLGFPSLFGVQLPDEQLLKLASQGLLNERKTLMAETERLLRDSPLRSFCTAFC